MNKSAEPPGSQEMRVLLVEDDVLTLRMVEQQLRTLGFEVSTAEDGLQGWQLLEEQGFSIVVTDWLLPGINGLELVRRLRSREDQGYTYVIVLTGKDRTEDLVEAMESGADDYLSKPFEPEELRVRIRAGQRLIALHDELAQRNRSLDQSNRRIREDLEAAARVQQTFLPEAKWDEPGLQIRWQFLPCDELAGDMLDILPLGEGRYALYVLDVSGHGAPSALLSVTVSSFIEQLVRTPQTGTATAISPEQVLLSLSQGFPWERTSEQFFTILFGIVDVSERLFRFSSAGHPYPIHLPCGSEPIAIQATGLPIGLGGREYDLHTVPLQPGDRVFLYSDGLAEGHNTAGEIYGEQRMTESIAATGGISLEKSLRQILQYGTDWVGGPMGDDLSILGLELLATDAPIPIT